MARVLQQRSGPPYLLIVFVFLFLAATTVALVRDADARSARKAETAVKADLAAVANPMELNDARIRQMVANYQEEAKAKHGPGQPLTVVGQFGQQINGLSQAICGLPTDANAAQSEADAVLKKEQDKLGARLALAPALSAAYDKVDQDAKLLAADAVEAKKNKDEKDKLQEMLDKANKDLTAQKEEVDKKLADLDAKEKKVEEDYAKASADAEKDHVRKVADLNKEIAAKTDRIAALEADVKKLQTEISKMQVGPGKGEEEKGAHLAREPAGTIRDVVADKNLCYIDIGNKEHVKPGLTFSVYAPGAMNGDANAKGSIEITAVFDDVSACRILDHKLGNPIAAGDVIANVAFNRNHTPVFVVEGAFDLYHTGKPTSQGAEEVRALIQRFGGKVAKEVDPQVDYVVVGEPPPKPNKPAEDEPAQVRAVREQQAKEFQRYQDIIAAAEKMGIPVLNANRFLALTGFQAPLAEAVK